MTTQHGPPPRGRRPRAAMAASAIAAVHPRAAPWRESSFHVERARLSPEALVVRRCSASVGRGRCRPMRASGRHWPTVSRGRTVGPPLESLEARTRGGRVEMAWFESTMEPRGTVESVRRNRRGAPAERPGEAAPVDRSRVMTVVSPSNSTPNPLVTSSLSRVWISSSVLWTHRGERSVHRRNADHGCPQAPGGEEAGEAHDG